MKRIRLSTLLLALLLLALSACGASYRIKFSRRRLMRRVGRLKDLPKDPRNATAPGSTESEERDDEEGKTKETHCLPPSQLYADLMKWCETDADKFQNKPEQKTEEIEEETISIQQLSPQELAEELWGEEGIEKILHPILN